jgi:PPOX class probable F420-dependent enzyme
VSVRMTDDEAWRFLAGGHTGILTSLRRDGRPVSLPVWFVVDGRRILVAGPAASAKMARVRRDERVAFVVERGRRWAELEAVHVDGRARLVPSPDWEAFDAMIDAKYAGFRTPTAEMPASARQRYDEARALIEIVADELISWDNHRLGSGS